MEETGVYWIILYEILETSGLDVWLVDGRQTKQVPGRKTDVKDCQWIQELHSHGLLNRCFVPDEQVKEIRSYQRVSEDHIRTSSMHVNHMQKALTEQGNPQDWRIIHEKVKPHKPLASHYFIKLVMLFFSLVDKLRQTDLPLPELTQFS